MTLHDAAMTTWRQWWRRNKRSGHAFAEGAFLHGSPPECHFRTETRRVMIWGAAIPAVALLLAALVSPWALLVLVVYPVQWLRIVAKVPQSATDIPWRYSAFLLLGKFPEAQGVLTFWLNRLRGRRKALIEYK